MNIFFDFEIKEYPNMRSVNQDARVLLTEVRELMEERLLPLKSQMIKSQEKHSSFVLILIKTASIKFIEYGEKLTQKMKDSLSEKDMAYIIERLKKVDILFMNKNSPNLN